MKGARSVSFFAAFLMLLGGVVGVSPEPVLAVSMTDDALQTMVSGGLERRYILHKLAATGPEKRPLVLVLHGGGGNAANAVQMFGFSQVALRDGAVVVYPEGSGRFKNKLKTWNADHCCGYAMQNSVDDIAFIGALIDLMIAKENVDPARVYVTGMSNGGMMAHRLGIGLADKIAAIAPVVGGLFGDEASPANKVSVLTINGGLDLSLPLNGGQTGGRFANAWDGTPLKPVLYQGKFWAEADGCEGIPKETQQGSVKTIRYSCPSGVDVVQMIAMEEGHTWPGGKPGSRLGNVSPGTLDASQLIWDFFKAHHR